MLILIDGPNGIGKSAVAERLSVLLFSKNAEYVESDWYWERLIEDKPSICYSGFFPSCSKPFLVELRETLNKKMKDYSKIPVVPISLTDPLCQEEFIGYFQKKGVKIIHVILEADVENVESRIENDSIRNIELQHIQKSKLKFQIQYLSKNYPDAIRINTNSKTIDRITAEIIKSLS